MSKPCVTLGEILVTDALVRRPERPRDAKAETDALRRVMQEIMHVRDPLDALVRVAVEVCNAGSAGVSLLEPSADGPRQFRWVAMAGAFASYVGGTTPADFSPCGATLARGSAQLFSYPERLFTYFGNARPQIVEGLVIPFTIDEQAGTIWIVSHDPGGQFTPGDVEFMTTLADFTATALSLQRSARREREARDCAEEANRLKDQFLATVCHELRTPLHSIVGWADVLEDAQVAGEEARDAIAGVRQAAIRQTRLVDDLLDMGRVASGHLDLKLEPIDFRMIIATVLGNDRPLADARRVRLEVDLGTEPATVSGDAGRLQQALENVFANAVKFTPAGGTVRIELARTGSDLVLRVSDTGIGIEAAFLPHVFERFRQADSSSRRRHGGLGLGLAIAQDIVIRHSGTIRAESAGSDRGATFTITLPATCDARATPHPVPDVPRAMGQMPRLDHVRILFLDDNADARDVIPVILRQRGAELQVAVSAAEARAILARWQPDLLLSDIAMPDEDGYDFIARIRRETSRSMKAAALTAYTTPAERERALRAGYDMHLSKPMTGRQLVTSIAALLQDSASPGQVRPSDALTA